MNAKKNEHKKKRTWVKTPTVFQMEATECGAASLSMILAYYDCFVALEQLRIDCGVSRDGCNARNIKKAAESYGFKVEAFSKEVQGLLDLPVPSIIHWNFNHFVVFEGVKNGRPYINDPGNGRRKLEWTELDECFTGIVLTFTKNEDFEPLRGESHLISYVIKRTASERRTLTAMLLAGLVLVVPGTAIPLFSQFFVDEILGQGNTEWTSYLLVIMAFTVIFQAFFTWLRSKIQYRLQIKLALVLGNRFVRHIMNLPIDFFQQRLTGELTSRVDNNNAVNNLLTGRLTEAVLNLIVAVLFLVILFLYSPLLTGIGLLSCALSILINRAFAEKSETIIKKQQHDMGKLIGAMYSGISITETLKASGCENEYVNRMLGYCAKVSWSEQRSSRINTILESLPPAISKIADVAVLIVGGNLVITGTMTAGMLVAFTGLLTSFTEPVNSIVAFLQEINTAKVNISRVEDIENYEPVKRGTADKKTTMGMGKLSGKIEVNNVCYGYSRLAPPIIDNVNISLTPGKIVALVGRTASGKSTVGKLVSGLVEPWSGEILYDGISRLKIKPDIFHASVATVSQENGLFSGTVRENITMWNPYVMDRDLVRACKDACIHDVITKLPGTYDFMLSERGANLSGGQRQRLEIASALVTNPTVLVLDEATAALDAITEKKIMDNIRKRSCSCVIIAHRLSTIKNADEILFMDHGHVIESGTHEELMTLGGRYAELIENA